MTSSQTRIYLYPRLYFELRVETSNKLSLTIINLVGDGGVNTLSLR